MTTDELAAGCFVVIAAALVFLVFASAIGAAWMLGWLA